MNEQEHEINNKNHEEKEINKFFEIINFLIKKIGVSFTPKKTYKLSPEEQHLSSQFDKYLSANVYDFCIEMINNGYQPSEQQSQLFEKKIIDNLVYDYDYIDKINQSFNKIPKKLFQIWYCSHYLYIKNRDGGNYKKIITENLNVEHDYNDIMNHFDNIIYKKLQNVIDNFFMSHRTISGMDSSDNRENVEALNNVINNKKSFFINNIDNFNIDQAIEFCSQLKEINYCLIEQIPHKGSEYYQKYFAENCRILGVDNNKYHIKTIENYMQTSFSKDKEKILQQTRNLYKEQYLEEAIQYEIHKEVFSVSKELPQAAKDLISKIEVIHDKINTDLSFEEKIEINNLFKNVVPNIIKKYILVDPEYRTSMKNIENKNAQELMIESLENVYKKFEEKFIQINEDRLSSLSATQRYTKKM